MAGDAYFDQVLCHLRGDGDDQATGFLDSGPAGRTVTSFSNMRMRTNQSVYGGSSAYFNGVSYMTVGAGAGATNDDWDLYYSDFTFSCHIRLEVLPTAGTGASSIEMIFCRRVGADIRYYFGYADYTGVTTGPGFWFQSDSNLSFPDLTFVHNVVLSVNTWYRVDLVRSGSTFMLFLDGTLVASTTSTTRLYCGDSALPLNIGYGWSGAYYFTGHIDDIHFSKVARYTATFTPPGAPLTDGFGEVAGEIKDSSGALTHRAVRLHRRDTGAVIAATRSHASTGVYSVASPVAGEVLRIVSAEDAAYDPLRLSVVTQLPFDGADAATATTDRGQVLRAKQVTPEGQATVSAAQTKYLPQSIVFDGASDRVTSPAHLDFALGTGDFTIDLWMYTTNGGHGGADAALIQIGEYNQTGMLRIICNGTDNPGKLAVLGYRSSNPFTIIAVAGTFSNDAWHHIELVRQAGVFTLYLDGTSYGTGTPSPAYPLTQGAVYVGNDSYSGYMDEVRITKGVARHTSGFTPPAAAAGTDVGGDAYFDSVALLMRAPPASLAVPGNLIADMGPTRAPRWAFSGAAQLDTAQKKFGSASLYLDGTAETYLYAATDTRNAFGTADFSIEMWVYQTATSSNFGALYDTLPRAGSSTRANSFLLYVASDSSVRVYHNGGVLMTSRKLLALNTWTKIHLSRESGVFRLFVDGVLVAQVAAVVNDTLGGAVLGLSAANSASTLNNLFVGYIDDVRVTRGYARDKGAYSLRGTAAPDPGNSSEGTVENDLIDRVIPA